MSINKRKPDVERGSFKVVEFCARHGLSLPTFHRLVAMGRGPQITRLSGRLSLISLEAEAEWLKAFTNPTPDVQAEIDAHAAQADAAGHKGFLSAAGRAKAHNTRAKKSRETKAGV